MFSANQKNRFESCYLSPPISASSTPFYFIFSLSLISSSPHFIVVIQGASMAGGLTSLWLSHCQSWDGQEHKIDRYQSSKHLHHQGDENSSTSVCLFVTLAIHLFLFYLFFLYLLVKLVSKRKHFDVHCFSLCQPLSPPLLQTSLPRKRLAFLESSLFVEIFNLLINLFV